MYDVRESRGKRGGGGSGRVEDPRPYPESQGNLWTEGGVGTQFRVTSNPTGSLREEGLFESF